MGMFYGTDQQDIVYILQFINEFTKKIGVIRPVVEATKIQSVIVNTSGNGCYSAGCSMEKASVFRKIGTFITYFVAERPIAEPFAEGVIIDELRRIANHQNAILAYELAVDSLYGAKIAGKKGEVELTNRISVSEHSYVDIIDAIANISPSTGMKLVSVLFEQLAYKSNLDCQYS